MVRVKSEKSGRWDFRDCPEKRAKSDIPDQLAKPGERGKSARKAPGAFAEDPESRDYPVLKQRRPA